MAEAYECDRCGEIRSGEPHRILEVKKKQHHRPVNESDLCRSCWEDACSVLDGDGDE